MKRLHRRHFVGRRSLFPAVPAETSPPVPPRPPALQAKLLELAPGLSRRDARTETPDGNRDIPASARRAIYALFSARDP